MDDYQQSLYKALNSSIRRSILLELQEHDQTPSYFAFIYELSPAAITKHLKILEEAKLIFRYRRGREVWCQINNWALKAMKVDWLIKLLL